MVEHGLKVFLTRGPAWEGVGWGIKAMSAGMGGVG